MKNTLTALLAFGLVPAGDLTDEQAAGHIMAFKKKADDAKNLRVTNRVQKAIDDKHVKAERKDALIAMGTGDEIMLENYLTDVCEGRTTQQPARRGSQPVPPEKPQAGSTEERIETLKGELKGSTTNRQVEIARELRTLRGHKDMFAKSA